jgi:transposase-like protein
LTASDRKGKPIGCIKYLSRYHSPGFKGYKEQITTDKEPALYAAIKNSFAAGIKHVDSKYKNNFIEQDYRAIKSRLCAIEGFKNSFCALRFCTVFKEIR